MADPDPFDVLGLPPRFDLDRDDVRRAYLAAAAEAHPDVHASRPDVAQPIASGVTSEADPDPASRADADLASGWGADSEGEVTSARLNRAKAILADPEQRAEALLVRLGGPARGDDPSLPDGFLMEIMETRTEIEEALAGGDVAERRRWQAWAEQERARATQEVAAMFSALGDPPAPEQLAGIRTRLNAWRYIERLIEQLDPDYDPGRADFER